jgi:hypothetical protein
MLADFSLKDTKVLNEQALSGRLILWPNLRSGFQNG